MPLKKTTLSLTELSGSSFNLDLKSRQLLILADGKRTVECIKQLRPNMDVHGIAMRLIVDGYLVGANGDQLIENHLNRQLLSTKAAPEERQISEESINQAKAIMIETTRRYIGIMGGDLVHKISGAKSLIQIRKCIAQWNMAMRDSFKGKSAANQHLQEVNLALGVEF